MPECFTNGYPSNDAYPFVMEQSNRNDKDGRHGGDIKKIDPIENNQSSFSLWKIPTLYSL